MHARPQIRKIVFTYDASDRLVDAVREILPDAVAVLIGEEDDLSREIVDAQMTIGPGYDADVLASASQLAWHHVPWAGVEDLPRSSMAGKGMIVTNSRGISAPNMAEHAIAFILAFARALPEFWREQQRRSWRGWDERPTFFELSNQTVLLLGTGAVGTAIATRLQPFGCRIVGVRRTGGSTDGFDEVYTFGELDEILPEADHVLSSLPITSFTEKIVDRDFIYRMKPGSYFYNLGRGGTVDQDALIEALHSGHLAGAGLDVTDPEPLPEDSPLWDAPNTIITGHTSGSSPLFTQRGAEQLRENLRRWVSGEELINQVDLEYGY